jgi:PAS domain-containing protein
MHLAWFQRLFANLHPQSADHCYMELVEQAIVGFLLRRPDGGILMVNDASKSASIASRSEVLNKLISGTISIG